METATVAARKVEYSVRAVGSIEAFEQVAVTARVAGVVERVRFREGDSVTAETALAEIEPERYRLATEAARAALAKAQATADEARNGLERRQAVNVKNPDLVRAEEVRERFQNGLATALEQTDAQVAEFEAEVEVARQGFARDVADLALQRALGGWPAGAPSPISQESP